MKDSNQNVLKVIKNIIKAILIICSVVAVIAGIFDQNRGLCLPSDNKMTAEQQDRVIEVVKACFE